MGKDYEEIIKKRIEIFSKYELSVFRQDLNVNDRFICN